ncbi:VCBS domain-containing protein [Pseudovibrio brasiliensis]|uniref:VCBS domain-containing protein n=2 Tax=Pseudovibrio brasiliensis TaxID=1898042 RepID=A0ABX8AQK6_9HYPH|nr:VCBS domain-containing protein [Pseudovibrio brasiliensis]QUS57323.1 VCBS domain-containing protein [Pseudovibrio brasiliensis]
MSNTPPQAFPVSVTINENGEVEIRVFFQDFDLGDTHNLEIHVGDMLGTSTVIDEETFRYDPGTAFDYLKPGETATDTFSYTVTDSAGATATETVTITLTGKNDGPVAVSVTAQTDEDTPITIAPDFSDADAGDSHTLTVDTEGTKGTVIVNEDGTFTYDPNGAFDELGKGESAVDTFTYTVTDASGATSTETVTVTINGLDENNPPITYPVELDAVEDGKIAFRVIFEDQDIGDTHTYEVDKDVLKGSLTEVGDRLFHYEPGVAFDYLAEGETSTDTFTYTVTDNSGASHTSTVIITVTGKNDAPVASSVDVSTSESSSVVITPDFSDADTNDSHTITVETDGTLGSVTVNDDGTFTYDPNGQFDDLDRGQSATDSFTYTVTDEMGVSSTQTVVVTVNGESEVAIQPGKIRASDGMKSDVFGLASQINDHGVIVVGAYGDDDKGDNSGSVYIYTPDGNGWFSETKLGASDGMQNDRFGSAVAINNSGVVAVSAPRDNDAGDYLGSVYAYIPTGGGNYKEVKLTVDAGVTYDYLGEDLVINDAGVIVASAFGSTDDRIVVFTPDEEGGYTQESLPVSGNGTHTNRGVHINEDGVISVGGLGSVTVFTPNAEGGYSELVLSAPDSNSSFGKHVAVESDGTIIVGGADAIFVYEPDGEGNYAISKFDALAGSSFAVSADGTIVVGHAAHNTNGAVQVYAPDGDGGYTRYDLTAFDGAVNDYFGYSVSIADDGTITVGAYADDDKGENSGSVYVFTRNEDGSYTGPDGTIYAATGSADILTYGEYVEPQGDATAGKIKAFDGTESDVFGLASQINDHGVIVVGAYGDDDKGDNSGSVYIYTPDGNGGFSETKLVASDGATNDRFGSVAAINNSGVVAVSATRDDDGTGNYFGSVYAYIPTDGGSYKEVKLTADVGVKYDYLGEDLVINDAGVIVASAFGSTDDRIVVFTPDEEGGYTQESLPVSGNGTHTNRGVHINEDGVISVGGLGSVTVFTPNAEGGYSELVLSAPDSNSSFGKHVAVESDGTIIVGGADAIFVYEPDGEGNYAISKFDALAGSSFAVSADGTIVVGHAAHNTNGAVQVYAPDGDGGYTRYDLTAFDGAVNDYFGYSVSIADDGTITVGAYADDDKGENSGSVYVFTRNEDGSYTGPDGTIYAATGSADILTYGEYVEPQGDATAGKIKAFDGTESDVFGLASQINDHGVIVVGAYGDDDKGDNSGSVYIYTPDGNGGFSETKLVASDGATNDRFGSVAAINNSGVVAVSATRDDDGTGNYFGSVYAYIPTDGGSYKEVKLTADVGVKYDYLGEDLVINDAGVIVASAFGSTDDRIVVFTPDEEGGYTQESLPVSGNGTHTNRGVHINEDGVISVGGLGSVTVFTPNAEGGYSELVLSAPDSNSSFGKHVAVESDGTIIVGGADAIFVYEPDGEGNYAISKFDALAGSSFAVSADGTIVVGHAAQNSNKGSVQVYAPDGDGGYTRYDLTAFDGAVKDYFGYAVSIADDGTITVGAYGDDYRGDNAGSVYVFTRNEDGSYTGPNGTIYAAAGSADILTYGEYVEPQGDATAGKIRAFDGTEKDVFGLSSQINDHGVIVVGAYGDDDKGDNSGSVYIYTPDGNGGFSETKLVASDGAASDRFGSVAAINNSGVVAVSASRDNDTGNYFGSVYAYIPTDGGSYKEVKLTADAGVKYDYLGEDLVINDAGVIVASAFGSASDRIVVFTPDGEGGYTQESLPVPGNGTHTNRGVHINEDGVISVGGLGSVTVFTPNDEGGYSELVLSAPDSNSSFGKHVAVESDGTIIVGGADAIFVYEPDGEGNYAISKFDVLAGSSFAVSADGTIVVGHAAQNSNKGSVQVYAPDGDGGYTRYDLTAFDAAVNDYFGYSVSIADDGTITVGAYGDDYRGDNAGSVYVFTRNEDGSYTGPDGTIYEVAEVVDILTYGEYVEPQGDATAGKIRAFDGTEKDVFGLSSQINDHGVIVVGAYGDDDKGDNSGSVYIYTPDGNGGFSETKLVASDGAASDRFGSVAAINNSGVVAVSASRDNDTGNYFGSVYAYIPTDGGSYKEVKLTADAGVKYDYLGEDLVINDAGVIVASAFGSASDRIVVFTPDGEGGYTQESLPVPGNGTHTNRGVHINEDGVISVGGLGSVTVFTPNDEGGYSELVLSAPDSNSSFGKHVAVESDGTIIVGGADAIFVYEPDGEGNYAISKFDALAGSSFAVSADGTIVVGHAAQNSNKGSVQVYAPDGDGGYTRYDLTAFDGAVKDYFGYAVSIADDGTITVGAYGDDYKGDNAGSVYVFTRNEDGSYTGPDGTIYEAAGPVEVSDLGLAAMELKGSEASDMLQGGDLVDTLNGNGGDDVIDGGAGDDILTGGEGKDTFVFASGELGHDTINDFSAGEGLIDVVKFETSLFGDFDEVLASAEQVGADTVITVNEDTSITLKGVSITDLHADDFAFV